MIPSPPTSPVESAVGSDYSTAVASANRALSTHDAIVSNAAASYSDYVSDANAAISTRDAAISSFWSTYSPAASYSAYRSHARASYSDAIDSANHFFSTRDAALSSAWSGSLGASYSAARSAARASYSHDVSAANAARSSALSDASTYVETVTGVDGTVRVTSTLTFYGLPSGSSSGSVPASTTGHAGSSSLSFAAGT
ncbi:MAG: hypothetical protein Q9191_008399, partial [Dirinaria sp. TL-2023a]